MENFDNLFENQYVGKQAARPFDKEAWAQRKQEERAHLYETIDGMTDLTLSGPEALSNYLTMQSQLGRTSVSNTLLILAQNPEASYVMIFDDWHERGRRAPGAAPSDELDPPAPGHTWRGRAGSAAASDSGAWRHTPLEKAAGVSR